MYGSVKIRHWYLYHVLNTVSYIALGSLETGSQIVSKDDI